MKKQITLTERDLARLVNRVLSEQDNDGIFDSMKEPLYFAELSKRLEVIKNDIMRNQPKENIIKKLDDLIASTKRKS